MANKAAGAPDEDLLDRALGAYLGLALGDALGATVEFMQPREIALQYGVHQQIIGGGWLKLRAGEVTDDTTMSLALGEALLLGERTGRRHDVGLIAESFAAWWRAHPVDCGNTCRRGIQRYLSDGSLEGPYNAGDAGNGALMRCLPAVLATMSDETAFKRLASAQARVTHSHPLSDAAVLGIGQLLRAVLRAEPRNALLARIDAFVQSVPAFRFSPYPGRASGYVVDTVQTALHFFCRHEDFRAAVVATVNMGDDADTTGAIVGMLAGARCGAKALPADWLARLQPAVKQAITEQTRALVALNPGVP